MNSLELTAGIVLPMFLLMLCGWILRRTHALPEPAFSQMNRLCFLVLLPASLLNNLLKMESLSGLRLPFLGWLLFLQALIVGLLYLTVPRLIRDISSPFRRISHASTSARLTSGFPPANPL